MTGKGQQHPFADNRLKGSERPTSAVLAMV